MSTCRDCFAPAGSNGYRCDTCQAEWDQLCAQYIAKRAAGDPEGWAHADCDHGNSYCTQTATNVYASRQEVRA